MRLPRVRFTVGRMMIAVAILALVCLVFRGVLERWLRHGLIGATSNSTLDVAWFKPGDLVAGRSIPISVTYHFQLNPLKARPGANYQLYADVWIENRETGRSVQGYTFDAGLKLGEREVAGGALTWETNPLPPGRYSLHRYLYSWDEQTGYTLMRGGSSSFGLAEATKASGPANLSAGEP